MQQSFKALIEASKSILVLLPTNPYFDQVAAGLSVYLAVKQNKEVSISSPSPMVVEFNRLVGVNKISAVAGDKNLVVRFVNYRADDVERVSYDIENGEFKLTVIPKPGKASPKQDNVDVSYAGLSADTVILIGGANENHFPILSSNDFAAVKLIHLGVRDLNLGQGKKLLSFAKPASSTSEVAADLIKEAGYKIDDDIATNLIMGIEEGSRQFSNNDVGPDTFELIARLMRSGGRRVPKQETRSYPRGAIPGVSPGVGGTASTLTNQSQGQVSKEEKKEAPKSWLQPKIYKGTSVS